MTKKRVHEIAKEQGLSSKELLEKLKAAGVEAKAAASSVDEALALKALGTNGAASNGTPAAQAKAPAPRHLRRHDRPDRRGRDGGDRSDSRQLWLDGEGCRRVPRRAGARGDQEADDARRDGDAHTDAVRRRA